MFARKSESLRFPAAAYSRPTSITAPRENVMPDGFTRYTCPLARSWPSISVGVTPEMRLSTREPALG